MALGGADLQCRVRGATTHRQGTYKKGEVDDDDDDDDDDKG